MRRSNKRPACATPPAIATDVVYTNTKRSELTKTGKTIQGGRPQTTLTNHILCISRHRNRDTPTVGDILNGKVAVIAWKTGIDVWEVARDDVGVLASTVTPNYIFVRAEDMKCAWSRDQALVPKLGGGFTTYTPPQTYVENVEEETATIQTDKQYRGAVKKHSGIARLEAHDQKQKQDALFKRIPRALRPEAKEMGTTRLVTPGVWPRT